MKRTIRSAAPLALGRLLAVAALLVAGGCAAVQPEPEAGVLAQPAEADTALGSYLAGRFAQDAQDYGAAADYLLRALEGDPQNPELLEDAIKALVGAGRAEEAREVAGRLIEVEPKAAGAHIVLALGELKTGAYDAAEARLAPLVPEGLKASSSRWCGPGWTPARTIWTGRDRDARPSARNRGSKWSTILMSASSTRWPAARAAEDAFNNALAAPSPRHSGWSRRWGLL